MPLLFFVMSSSYRTVVYNIMQIICAYITPPVNRISRKQSTGHWIALDSTGQPKIQCNLFAHTYGYRHGKTHPGPGGNIIDH